MTHTCWLVVKHSKEDRPFTFGYPHEGWLVERIEWWRMKGHKPLYIVRPKRDR